MRFDRKSADGGVEVECVLENGKALLTWKFHFEGYCPEATIQLALTDREGRPVLVCLRQEPEEEPLQAIMLHPRLWDGVESPYLYQAEVCLLGSGGCLLDRLKLPIAMRSLYQLPGKGFYLNNQPFEPRTVNYSMPAEGSAAVRQNRMLEDFQLLRELGANSIFCGAEGRSSQSLMRLCDRLGFLVWSEMAEFDFREGKNRLMDSITDRPGPLFYRCKARWSRKPFVYLDPASVCPMKSGNYRAVVYSNSTRVALYTDGVLFEFRSGEGEFVFEEIPARRPCVMLTAETDECCMSFSVHRQKSSSR